MKSFINKYKFQLILFFIVFILFLVNYKPGTYLSGWDNLQTELNPGLAVKRAFFSVWEEYQSFGLTAGMAHAADLPRAVFLWVTSFVLPQNMIRYFYHMLMLLIGGIGAFSLFRVILGRNEVTTPESLLDSGRAPSSLARMTSEPIIFFGALFYMLNLGTVQIFYLPYEAFSTFFALLPWGIWIFIKIISNIKYQISKRDVLLFLLINLLGTPAFYTQQLFIVYMLILIYITASVFPSRSLSRLWRDSSSTEAVKNFLKKTALTFSIILLINSFWILPQFYFLKTNGKVVSEAKTNQLSTENVYLQNYEKGTLGYFLKLEGFYFDLKGKDGTFLFAPWKDHFKNPVIGIISYLFAGLMLIGLVKSLTAAVKYKQNQEQTAAVLSLGFILIFLLCVTGLLLATPPFSWINETFRKAPIINQIFRSPFTKFIIPYSLVYSYFVAKGLSFFGAYLKKVSLYVMFILILLYSLPSFKGYFISPEIKVKIPNDYFQVINYFKAEDKNKRIALSPDYTFWGWFFNKWGYNGSGFLWYGIEQPIVSRTFDVWSKTSESYFWEAKTAFESEDVQKIINVFDKYQIDYLILDRSLIPVTSSYKALQYDRIDKLLTESPNITLIFSGKNISLYEISHQYYAKKFVSLSTNLNNIGPKIDITNDDQAFSENGFYISDNLKFDLYYPFFSLTSQTNLQETGWQITEDDNFFYLSAPLTINSDDFDLYLNDIYQETILVDSLPTNISLRLAPIIENNKLIIKIEKKVVKDFDANINQKTDFGFTDQALSQNIGYLVRVQSINNQGSPLFFYIVDETKKQSYLEDRLDNQISYFILPPRYKYGLGYTFAFQNKFFKNLTASNNLEQLSLYLFPYQALKEMKFVRKGFSKTGPYFSNNYEVEKINYFTYKVSVSNTNMIILNQSFDPSWIAFSNGKILKHVSVNNWANGWKLDGRSSMIDDRNNNQGSKINNLESIAIIFWPQYLEFLGFGLLFFAFLLIIRMQL